MSADVLRQAATLMRERAKAARAGIWFSEGVEIAARWNDPRSVAVAYGSEVPEGNVANAAHIASWHPAVALAVADLLDSAAGHVEYTGLDADEDVVAALAVARAYLGKDT